MINGLAFLLFLFLGIGNCLIDKPSLNSMGIGFFIISAVYLHHMLLGGEK